MIIRKSVLEGLGLAPVPLPVEPRPKPKYMLAELLAQCDATSPVSAEEQEWQDMGQAGFEVW